MIKKTVVFLLLFLLVSVLWAEEISVTYNADCNVYAIIKDTSSRAWNDSIGAVEVFADANIGDYDMPLTEVNDVGSCSDYIGDFNSSIPAGNYIVKAYLKAGDDPNVLKDTWIAGPTPISWDGSEITDYTIYAEVNGLDGAAMRGTDNAALAASTPNNTYWTPTRAGYLDKLNVSGTLAHSDANELYKADVSAILEQVNDPNDKATVAGRLADLWLQSGGGGF